MKKSLQIFALLFCIIISAQAPEKFSYQAVIRNASNVLITNATVGVKISILKTSAAGTVVYSESQTPTTNANGLISIQIGAGSVITGSISGIDWGADSYFIKTETDPSGGTAYSIAGTTQLLSVPYALFAKNSAAITPDVHIASVSGSSQSVATNLAVIINSWGGLEETGGANYNATTGEYTIPISGFYSISSQVQFGGNAANNALAEIGIFKNGALLKAANSSIIVGNTYPILPVSTERKLVVGDKIKIYVYHTNPTSLTLQANLSGFGIHLIHK